MEKTITKKLAEIRERQNDRDYSEVVRLLNEIDYRQIESDEDKSEYHHLFARYYRAIGEFEKGLNEIDSAIKLNLDKRPSRLADLKYLRGRILMGLGRITDALESYSEAQVSYQLANEDDRHRLWGLLLAKAHAQYLKGDLREALRVVDTATNAAKTYNTSAELFHCEANAARIMLFLGDFDKAEPLLRRLLDTEDVSKANTAFILQSYGMLNLYRLDTDKAQEFLSDSLDIYQQLNMSREAVVSREYLGLNEYFAQNYNKAIEYYTEILKRQDPAPHAAAKSQTLRMLTDAYIATGKFNKAEETADKAKELIEKIKEQIELGAVSRAYGLIHAYRNRKEAALESFEHAAAFLEPTQARYEIALMYLARCKSGIYDEDLSAYYYKRAERLFEEMNVRGWQDRIGVLQNETGLINERRTRHATSGHDPIAVANTILDIAWRHGEKINLMKLQKLVYYAHGWNLAIKKAPLINEEIQARDFGPVIESVYDEFKRYGNSPIKEYGRVAGEEKASVAKIADPYTLSFLERIWQVFGRFSDVQLSNMAHDSSGPWAKMQDRRDEPPYNEIRNTDIEQYFESLASRKS